MNLRSIVAVSAVALAAVACGPQESATDTDDTWVGTITTEANVTTVINESGSVWGGTATLVEEASIGVESGADEYMFSYIMSVFGTDEHIYVVDEQADLLRRYDHDGAYVDTIGGVGEGPGEYANPVMVAVDPAGRILVFDLRAGRTQVYGPDGVSDGYWPTPSRGCCAWPMLIGDDGGLWMPTRTRVADTTESVYGIRAFGPAGAIGDNYPVKVIEVPEIRIPAGNRSVSVPFMPRFAWTPAGAGLILAGASDRYRFEVQQRGATALVVEKYWEPVPIDPEHAEWRRRVAVASGRRYEPGWNWRGSEIPDHYPAYAGLMATAGGEYWVTAFAPARRLSDCVEDPLATDAVGEMVPALQNPCWRDSWVLDAFDAEGRYLGEIDIPLNLQPFPLWTHVVGDRVIGVEMDEFGTFMVKRYRLVLPGESE